MIPQTKEETLSWLLTHAGVESETSRLLIYNTLIEARDREREAQNKKKITKPAKKFEPPAIGEFIIFFKDNGYTEELALRVYKGYEAANWKDSNNKPIKNWKQKVIHVWFTKANKPKTKPRREKLFTYTEMAEKVQKGERDAFEKYQRTEVDGKAYWKLKPMTT